MNRRDAIKAELRARGLRATPARIAVLGALRETRTPRSHPELVKRLPNKQDRATVFRTLLALTGAGLATRIDLGDHLWRYTAIDPVARTAMQARFVCTRCGSIHELDDLVLAQGGGIGSRAIVAREIDVSVRGRCNDCW